MNPIVSPASFQATHGPGVLAFSCRKSQEVHLLLGTLWLLQMPPGGFVPICPYQGGEWNRSWGNLSKKTGSWTGGRACRYLAKCKGNEIAKLGRHNFNNCRFMEIKWHEWQLLVIRTSQEGVWSNKHYWGGTSLCEKVVEIIDQWSIVDHNSSPCNGLRKNEDGTSQEMRISS